MVLTSAQQTTLKNHIVNTPILNNQPSNEDGAAEIARLLNLQADPAFTVWKTNVSLKEVGNAFDGSEFESLTTAETSRLHAFAAYSAGDSSQGTTGGIDPSMPDRRSFFDDIFNGAGGNVTRPNLAALWRRLASEIEKLLADTTNGDGSDATPATLVFEGNISRQDVFEARNS